MEWEFRYLQSAAFEDIGVCSKFIFLGPFLDLRVFFHVLGIFWAFLYFMSDFQIINEDPTIFASSHLKSQPRDCALHSRPRLKDLQGTLHLSASRA